MVSNKSSFDVINSHVSVSKFPRWMTVAVIFSFFFLIDGDRLCQIYQRTHLALTPNIWIDHTAKPMTMMMPLALNFVL